MNMNPSTKHTVVALTLALLVIVIMVIVWLQFLRPAPAPVVSQPTTEPATSSAPDYSTREGRLERVGQLEINSNDLTPEERQDRLEALEVGSRSSE